MKFHSIKNLQLLHHNDELRYMMSIVLLFLLLIFEVYQQGALVNFMLHFEQFGREVDLWSLFSLKPYKAFGIAQRKKPWLVKPGLCLNFRFKFSGTLFLENRASSYFPPATRTRKIFSPELLDTSKTALGCIFDSSILNCILADQMNLIIKEWKYISREPLKDIFLLPIKQ